jgi:hypothetical protein
VSLDNGRLFITGGGLFDPEPDLIQYSETLNKCNEIVLRFEKILMFENKSDMHISRR